MKTNQRLPLGQLLVKNGIIAEEDLSVALHKQKETGELLGSALIKLGFVDEESIFLPILATQLGVEFIKIRNLTIRPEVIMKVPARLVSFYKVLPIDFEDNVLTIATNAPFDIDIIDGVHVAVSCKLRTVLASEKEIVEGIRQYYGVGAETIDQMMGDMTPRAEARHVENIEEIDSEASIGKFINQILLEAYKDRATDIHIEPFEKDLKIRYRVDGVLQDAQVPVNIWHFKDSINSRIKIMANLNIAEKRLPQDGRFKVRMAEGDLDLRVSFLPTEYGESLVIRILSSAKLYSMPELGLQGKESQILDSLIQKPHGIVFVTGPTGSGKTTTLYSCLSKVNTADKKIITIEDPVEYQLKGVTQMQIHPAIGLTFAQGLRSMLRHDPDVMMVGEVRDIETAEIAIQIALTGHLVFSTLHTNDAASGITRLIDMGVGPYLISSSVECFIAQRLVRRICLECKEAHPVTAEMIDDFGLEPGQWQGKVVYEGKGCEACHFSGYYGREGIYEFLLMTDAIREMVTAKASAEQIKRQAVESGMKTLMDDGLQKVAAGITSLSEIMRVTQEATE
ncbi:GspE/PulE family protein [Candidatus Omnitrophota bacterium]